MRERVFLDTNIVLDFVYERSPFLAEASALFQLRDDDEVELYISALTLSTLAYIAQREKKNPRQVISVLLEWLHVLPLDKNVFQRTLSSGFKDFEDGLQYFSAETVKGLDAIITRNKKDFNLSSIPVYTAAEYINQFKEKN